MAEPWESLPDAAPAASAESWESLPDVAPEVAPSVQGFTAEDISREVDALQPTGDELRLQHAFEEARRQGPRATQVLRVAQALGVPTRQVELNFDVFRQSADEVGDDPRRFQKENPLLASVILKAPHLGPAVLVDKQAGTILKAYRSALDWVEDTFGLMTDSEKAVEENFSKQLAEDPDAAMKVDLPAVAEAAKVEERRQRDLPRKQLQVDTPEARAIRNEGGLVGGALTLWRRGKEMRAQLNLADAQSRLAWAEYQGDEETAQQLRTELYNAKLAATPEALGESGYLADAVQAVEGATSTLDVIEGAAKGAGVTAAVAGTGAALVTGAVTKSPAAAARAFWLTVKATAPVGAKVNAAATTFKLEFGPAYEELRSLRTDAGKELTVEEAFGAAVFTGAISSSLELVSLGKQLQPFDTAKATLTGHLRQRLATDPTARALARRLAKEWATGTATEGLTEGAQQAVAQLGQYLGATARDEQAQRKGPFQPEGIIEAGMAGLKGGALFATVGVSTAAATARTLSASQQQAKQVPVLLAMAGNDTIKAAPEDFARVVQEATAQSGAPVTALHVDGPAALKYFQENEADPEAAMVAALGPDGPKRVAQAAASGGRIEVPVEEALTTWGSHPAAAALAADTATQAGLMTPKELQERGPEVQAEAERLVQEELQSATEDEAFETALADQVDTLIATRRVGVRDAKAWGLLARRVWQTAAKRQGIAPAELLKQMSVTFARGNEGQLELGEEATLAERRAILGPPPGPRQVLAARREAQRLDTPEGLEARRRDFFIDSTTGLLNARAWARIEPKAQTVASISIEGVKFSNDNLGGHAAGDATYAAAARALERFIPGLAKVGGDFAAADLTQEQLDGILEEANKDPALQGYRLSGVVAAADPSQKESALRRAAKAHNAAKSDLEAAGQRAKRGSKPLGAAAEVRLDAKPLEGRAIPEELLPQLPEQAFDEEHFEAKTGLLTKDGRDRYLAMHPKKHWVALDLNLLKAFNDLLDEAAGDQVLEAFGLALAELGGERFVATHVSGDEYSLHGDNLEELEAFAAHVTEQLLERVVTVTTADGREASWQGLSFGVGVGENVDAAEGSLNEHKARLTEEGFRGVDPEDGKRLVEELLSGATLSERSLAAVAARRREQNRLRALRGPAAGAVRQPDAGGEGAGRGALPPVAPAEAPAADDAGAAGRDAGEVGRVAAEPSGAEESRSEEAEILASGLNTPQAFENARAAVKRMRVGVTKAERQAKTKKAKKAARRQAEDRLEERRHAFTAFLDWAQGVGPRPVPAGLLTKRAGVEVSPEALREAVLFFRNEFDIVDPDTGITDLMADAGVGRPDPQLRREKRHNPRTTYERELARDRREQFNENVLGRVTLKQENEPPGSAPSPRQTETPEFKAWFRGSQVVDATGQPLVVFHGTPKPGHSEFRSRFFNGVAGYFAEDPAVAGLSAEPVLESEAEANGAGGVYPVFLSIKKPVDLSHLNGEQLFTPAEFAAALPFEVADDVVRKRNEELTRRGYRLEAPVWSHLSGDTFRSLMRAEGFDGVIYNESTPESLNELIEPRPATDRRPAKPSIHEKVKTSRSFIAFTPEQVKSAVGNRGTFDPANPNILMQENEPPGPGQQEELARIVDEANAAGIKLDVSERELITVSRIVVPESQRGAGRGSAIMEQLTRYADRVGKVMALTPSADFGGSVTRLRKFYKRFGFTPNRGRSRIFETRESYVRLPAEKQKQIETPAFKRWFGSSKVVDESGKPKVVFHGTGNASFDAFDVNRQDKRALFGPGFYTTEDAEVAGTYVDKGDEKAAQAIYPLFLSIQNPIDLDRSSKDYVAQLLRFKASRIPPFDIKRMIDSALREDPGATSAEGIGAWIDNTQWAYDIADRLKKGGLELVEPYFDYILEKARDHMVREIRSGAWGKAEDIVGFIERNVFRVMQDDRANIKEVLEMLGFDGIAHTGGNRMGGGHEHQVWIAFRPEQVKSATGNRGTFDPADPSILRQDEDKPGAPRGYISIPTPEAAAMHAGFNIFLNRRADASTIIHESGHAWLEMLHVLARRADATAETKELVTRARRWLGASEDLSVPLTREQHETFARGFEAYLFEGKAPVAELEGVFARFKAWLVSIYRTIRSLNVELNDDARGVFDSLLATDTELEAYRRDSGPAMWSSAEEAGMSPEAWEAHLEELRAADERTRSRVAAQALRERQRELETWWQEQRAILATEVAEEFEQLPARRAQRGIREGIDIGEVRGEPVWFDRQAVIDLVGEFAARRVPTVLEGGTHPDEVADFYGYGSGGELLGAVTSLPSKERFVELEVAARLREQHPSIVDEREQLREAIAQADAGHKERAIIEELAALEARDKRLKAPTLDGIRQAAARIVEETRVRAIIPARALQRERAAANAKARAAAQGDVAKAMEAGTQQLLQASVYQEMLGAKAEREALEELAREMSTDRARARWGKAAPAYRDAIDFLVTATQLRGKARLTAPQFAEGHAALRQALTLMEADAVTVGDWVEPLDRVLAKNDWRTLTVKEMRHLAAALENLRAAARQRNTVLLDGRRVEKEVVVEMLLKEPTIPARPPPGTASADTTGEAIARGYNAALGFLLSPPDMLRELVQDKQDSVWWKVVMEPLRAAKQREADILDEMVKPMVEAFEKVPASVRARMWESVDGARLFPTHVAIFQPPRRRFELLMMALNMGNAGNKQRLLDGRGITEEQVVAALDTLTKEELDWVQSIFDASEKLRPAAFALEERDSGLRPEAVAALPLKLKAGTLRGGYFPAVYERAASQVGERQAAQALADLMDPSYTRGGTPHSHLKKRADQVEAVISLEPDTIYRHMAQVAHDLAFREAVKSVGSIVIDPQVDQFLKSRLGDGKARQFLQWVKDAGSNRGAIPNHIGQKTIQFIRRNAAPAILGWSLPTAIGDIANLPAAVASTELKAKYLAAGVLEYRLNDAVREEALKKSPELRFMRDTVRRDFAKQVKSLTARGPLARGPLAWYRDNAFLFMEAINAATSTPIWLGAYKQALDAGRTEGEAVKWADDILTRVYPSHSPVEQAAILRDKGFWGMVTMFYGYLSVMFRAQYGLIRKRKLLALVGLWVSAGVFGELLMGRGPEAGDADDEAPEDAKLRWRNWFMRKLVAAPLSTLPFEAAGTFEARVLGKPTNPRGSPVNALLDTVLDNAGKALDGEAGAAERGLAAARAVAPLAGIPTRPLQTTVSYFTSEETGDDGPLDVAAGLVYGRRREQPANILRPLQ